MNIDVNALRAIEEEKGISVRDLLTTIASALLHAYHTHRGSDPHTRARVDINPEDGAVRVIVTELDADGNIESEFDDTPRSFGRIGAVAVRDAIVKRLREAETIKAFDSYVGYEGNVVSGVVQADARARERGIVVVQLGTELEGQDGVLLR